MLILIRDMTVNKKENKAISLSVTEGLSVTVLPSAAHEFLMTTRDVAHGYGASSYSIRQAQSRHSLELVEGKHFIKGVTFCHTLANAQPHQVFWTKRGIVRLGFFIKSEQARLFRDWAEELIISLDNKDLFGNPTPPKQLTTKRKHNRLTQQRLVGILADVCRIDDKELRMSITNKLIEGGAI